MTVFKVMFTAIITAMIGLYGLAKIGFLDLDATWINPTFLWPQIVGGLLLGAGFIISGYCPGTSLVASASGKVDGMLTILGVAVGIFIFGAAYTPGLEAFHKSGSFGRLTLSDLLGVDATLLALAITVGAGIIFIFAEWVERRFKHIAVPGVMIEQSPRVRYATMLPLVVIALAFAFLTSSGMPSAVASGQVGEISPVQLAEKILEGNEEVTVLDVRPADQVESGVIPQSRRVDETELSSVAYWLDNLPGHHLYVVVGSGGFNPDGLKFPPEYRVAILRDGFEGWERDILSKPELPATVNSTKLEEFRLRQALYSYFTGAAVSKPKIVAPPPVVSGGGKKKKPSGGC